MSTIYFTIESDDVKRLYTILYTNAPNFYGRYSAKLIDAQLALVYESNGTSIQNCLALIKKHVNENMGKVSHIIDMQAPKDVKEVFYE